MSVSSTRVQTGDFMPRHTECAFGLLNHHRDVFTCRDFGHFRYVFHRCVSTSFSAHDQLFATRGWRGISGSLSAKGSVLRLKTGAIRHAQHFAKTVGEFACQTLLDRGHRPTEVLRRRQSLRVGLGGSDPGYPTDHNLFTYKEDGPGRDRLALTLPSFQTLPNWARQAVLTSAFT